MLNTAFMSQTIKPPLNRLFFGSLFCFTRNNNNGMFGISRPTSKVCVFIGSVAFLSCDAMTTPVFQRKERENVVWSQCSTDLYGYGAMEYARDRKTSVN